MASSPSTSSEHHSTAQLSAALSRFTKQSIRYESQMKELESKLAENLSNFRAIDSLLQDSLTLLQRNSKRANRALNHQVPHINSELDGSKEALEQLSKSLPAIEKQVSAIRVCYDSGRQTAREFMNDLEWLNTRFYERWRIIIFTSRSPVSFRTKCFMRSLFGAFFAVFAWFVVVVLRGVY